MRYSLVSALALGSSLINAAPTADLSKRADFAAPEGGDATILSEYNRDSCLVLLSLLKHVSGAAMKSLPD